MNFYFKNTKRRYHYDKKDEEDYRNYNNFRFCENNIECDKVRYHCHLTRKYRDPSHSKYNINVTQDENNFLLFIFHNFSIYDCHMFFKKNLLIRKMIKEL